jgi:hypothetical protein
MDGRKNNKGTKGNKGGRPKGNKLMKAIDSQCRLFINEILKDEFIKEAAMQEFLIEKKTSDFFYLIKVGDLYKVGITSNLKRRIKQYSSHSGYVAELIYSIQTDNPNVLEVEILNQYSSKEKQGDWMRLELVDVVRIISYCSNKVLIWNG